MFLKGVVSVVNKEITLMTKSAQTKSSVPPSLHALIVAVLTSSSHFTSREIKNKDVFSL